MHNSFISNKRVLVTGATGFVGSCLTRSLVKLGCDVYILTRESSNKWRILDLLDSVKEHQIDLRDFELLKKTISEIQPKIIYHLATYGGFSFQDNTTSIFESNLLGTIHLLKACEGTEYECFINTGSSSEYGIKKYPMKEDNLLQPIGDYGVSKCASTLFCQSEAVMKGLPIITFRLFSPYGPLDDDNRFIPYVIKSFLKGTSPRVSAPDYVRDFVYIDDVIRAYLEIGMCQIKPGEIYNIGSGLQSSIGEVANILSELIENSPKPIWGEIKEKKLEPSVWVADISKAKEELKWYPSVNLKNGLEKTVNWFRKELRQLN